MGRVVTKRDFTEGRTQKKRYWGKKLKEETEERNRGRKQRKETERRK